MNINFINNPQPEKQQELYRWYRVTTYGIALFCICFLTINAYQWYALKTGDTTKQDLKNITEQMNTITERFKQLNLMHEQLNAREASLHKQVQRIDPEHYLRAIAMTIPDDVCLSVADVSKKGNVQLSGYAQSTHILQQFMEALSTKGFHALHLASLQPENVQQGSLYRFGITGQLLSHPSDITLKEKSKI